MGKMMCNGIYQLGTAFQGWSELRIGTVDKESIAAGAVSFLLTPSC